jgi:hypothetical protein
VNTKTQNILEKWNVFRNLGKQEFIQDIKIHTTYGNIVKFSYIKIENTCLSRQVN